MFREKRLFRKIICGIKNNDYTGKEIMELLHTIPIKVLRRIAKEIIYADYDGYNGNSKNNEMCYFDSLDRWQKEFFVQQRLYKLYT